MVKHQQAPQTHTTYDAIVMHTPTLVNMALPVTELVYNGKVLFYSLITLVTVAGLHYFTVNCREKLSQKNSSSFSCHGKLRVKSYYHNMDGRQV